MMEKRQRFDHSLHERQLRQLHAEGHDDRHIGNRMGFDPGTIRNYRSLYGLKANTAPKREIPHQAEESRAIPEKRANPIEMVKHWFGRRLADRGELGSFLDGDPQKLPDLVRIMNAERRDKGLPQFDVNPFWMATP